MKTRAVIYTRISKDLQHEGLGVARQLVDCRKYAQDRGYEVVRELEDNDVSASGLKTRESYIELRGLMEAGAVDIVIVYSMDRLHRNMFELLEYINIALATNVLMASVTDGGEVDLATPDGRFRAGVLGLVATHEREKGQQRIKRKHLELATTGKWMGVRVYGQLKDSTIVEAEAVIIKEFCERILSGEGFNDIARDLNDRGVPTLKGTKWRASSIIGIARSARIAGHREHHGVISARDCWPAIIDDETSMLLRARLAPGRSGDVKRGGPRKHLLTGLLRCGKCGTGLVRGLAGKTKVPNYRCPKNQGAAACGSISINLASTEEYLARVLFAAHDRTNEADTSDEALSVWAIKRAALEERKAQLAELVGSGAMEIGDWVVASGALKKQLDELPEPQIKAKRTRTTGNELKAAWPDMPVAAKRALFEDAFIKVTVLPRRIVTGAKVFDPGRLDPHWRH